MHVEDITTLPKRLFRIPVVNLEISLHLPNRLHSQIHLIRIASDYQIALLGHSLRELFRRIAHTLGDEYFRIFQLFDADFHFIIVFCRLRKHDLIPACCAIHEEILTLDEGNGALPR